MAGENPLDFRTKGSAEKAEVGGPYTRYLKKDALRGKRFGVPAFMLETQEDKPAAGDSCDVDEGCGADAGGGGGGDDR